MFYIKENENIVLYNTDREILENTKVLMPQYSNLEILETDRPIVDFRFADTEEYISEKAAEERKRIDNLTLTLYCLPFLKIVNCIVSPGLYLNNSYLK